MTRSTVSTPRKSQKAIPATKKKNHVTNGDIAEVEDVYLIATSSSGSGSGPEPLPSDSDDSSTGNKASVSDESDEQADEEVVIKKKKTSAKKRKITKADEDDAKCLFPMNRIKMIAKSEGGDDMRLSHEAIFLLNKASEKFLELFCEEAFAETVNESKNYVAYHHLSASISKEQRLCFLSDLIPAKITAEEALKERQLPNADQNASTTN